MTSGQLNQVLRRLCRLVGAASVDELTDRQLLEAFARERDPAAFEALVRRHGPMVLGVCRRVLHDAHDAEDAFQATFMVLARKADAIRRREAVGSWLCGTAYRLALKARAAAQRRRQQERQAGQMAKSQAEPDPLWQELRPVLDEELNRLPDKYRAPLVLCYLQGKTNEAAARELGWPIGSISYRLAQGREMLRHRLLRRGIALPSTTLAALLTDHASAAVQEALLDATVQASVAFAAGETAALAGTSVQIIALAEAGVRGMFWAKVKVAAVVLFSFLLVGGTAGIAYWIDQPHNQERDPPSPAELDMRPRLVISFSQSQRFGLACPHLRDPRDQDRPKLLTREPNGLTNNTCFRIDNVEYLFGSPVAGVRWVRDKNQRLLREVKVADHAWHSAVEVVGSNGKPEVRIDQLVELIRGEQTGLLDTVLVKYHLQNLDAVPHMVGLRFLLDTLIGMNDGVPFLIPPTDQAPARLLDTLAVFERRNMPPFIRALETDRLDDRSGTVAELNVKLQGYEPLERLVICRWPDNSEVRWDWAFRPINDSPPPDSCVVLYWSFRTMQPGEERWLGFTYGLGQLYGDGSGSSGGSHTASRSLLRLLIAGSAKVGGILTATAYIHGNALAGHKIALLLPTSLAFAPGQKAEQEVPRAGSQGYSQVSWRLRALTVGRHKVKVNLLGHTLEQEVKVRERSLFD